MHKSEFSQQVCKARGCDHRDKSLCMYIGHCTDVAQDSAVQLVITNYARINAIGSSQPVHLHGHSLYVGYPEYNESGYY